MIQEDEMVEVSDPTTTEAVLQTSETTTVPVKIYIDEIKVEQSEKHTRDIKLDEIYTLRMKYPSLNQFIESNFAIANDEKVTVDDS